MISGCPPTTTTTTSKKPDVHDEQCISARRITRDPSAVRAALPALDRNISARDNRGSKLFQCFFDVDERERERKSRAVSESRGQCVIPRVSRRNSRREQMSDSAASEIARYAKCAVRYDLLVTKRGFHRREEVRHPFTPRLAYDVRLDAAATWTSWTLQNAAGRTSFRAFRHNSRRKRREAATEIE